MGSFLRVKLNPSQSILLKSLLKFGSFPEYLRQAEAVRGCSSVCPVPSLGVCVCEIINQMNREKGKFGMPVKLICFYKWPARSLYTRADKKP